MVDSRVNKLHSKDLVGRKIGVNGWDVNLSSQGRSSVEEMDRLSGVVG